MEYRSGLDDILLERVRFGELFDVYSRILTEKQREACELLLGDDLSVAELGEELRMSRQGAYDLARRSLERLEEIERALGLLELLKAHRSLVSLIESNGNILPGEFLESVRRIEGFKITSDRGETDV
ncbi:MAG: DNA-binding protein [Synergistaceae bacterium]|nr:DNA-binding protein [Synergistaceae bacterium]